MIDTTNIYAPVFDAGHHLSKYMKWIDLKMLFSLKNIVPFIKSKNKRNSQLSWNRHFSIKLGAGLDKLGIKEDVKRGEISKTERIR